jgi:hypothetical protein
MPLLLVLLVLLLVWVVLLVMPPVLLMLPVLGMPPVLLLMWLEPPVLLLLVMPPEPVLPVMLLLQLNADAASAASDRLAQKKRFPIIIVRIVERLPFPLLSWSEGHPRTSPTTPGVLSALAHRCLNEGSAGVHGEGAGGMRQRSRAR